MKLSQTAQQALDRIKAKIEIKAIDFKGAQLNDLAIVYHEVTLNATGKGRVMSKGCTGCIPPAVHICYNYLQTIKEPEIIEEPAKVITVQVDEWNDLTKAELWEQVKKRGLSAPSTATKAKLIEVLNAGK
jgi:reverse gyrase